ncbi:MAG TPA: hypothetical protein DDZ80_25720, partial [Cyanobacteria bacterium UBA8803]|nr:hypothetical protein [Cyanobacteria bacterium UBA8803]
MNCEPRTTATTATHAKAYVFASLIAAALFSYPATAQTPVPETTSAAANLRIAPRIGAGYDTSGGGYDGFTRFEGFLPLVQTSGNNLWFLEGRLLLDNGAHLGSNILVGYRTYTPGLNRAFGGYIGYDTRNTGDSTFNQLGLGVESLGAIWDFRLNGYIPIGDTRQVAATRGFDTGLQLTGSPVFQGNSLLLPGERRFGQTTIREAAMGGVDFEIGAKIAQFTNGGDLRGYGGLYYYNASGSPSFVGGRLRLEIRPTDYLKLGLGLQHDDQFGTNLLVSIGATFPGTRPQGSRGEDESVWLRMGESVSRTASILVDEQVESAGFTQQSTLVATNPVTGKPYVFRHVNQGIGTGDGTAENPTGTVATALNEAQYDDIVYVQPGANTGIPAFTIPDGVQVLSTGPVQQINTAEFGLVRLTGSGAGVLPAVTGTVTMGNDSVLSGFAITSTSGPGIVARTIGNGTIRDNQVTSFSEAGVLLENPTGAITLTNNAIAGNGVPALVGININNVTLTGGSLTSTDSATNGITLNGVRGIFDLSSTPVTVTNAKGSGLLATNI